MSQPLTLRQERFVEAILDPNTKSQAHAARIAGYSLQRAHPTGSEVVRNRNVSEAIRVRKEAQGDKARKIANASLSLVSEVVENARISDDYRIKSDAAVTGLQASAIYREKFGDLEERERTSLDSKKHTGLLMLRAVMLGARLQAEGRDLSRIVQSLDLLSPRNPQSPQPIQAEVLHESSDSGSTHNG